MTVSAPPTFPFLALPPEVRLIVYDHLFDDLDEPLRRHALRNVSHFLHDEVTPTVLRRMNLVVYRQIYGQQTVRTTRLDRPACCTSLRDPLLLLSWSNFRRHRLASRLYHLGAFTVLNDNPGRIQLSFSKRFGKDASFSFVHYWLRASEPRPSDDRLRVAEKQFKQLLAAWPSSVTVNSLAGIDTIMVDSDICGRHLSKYLLEL